MWGGWVVRPQEQKSCPHRCLLWLCSHMGLWKERLSSSRACLHVRLISGTGWSPTLSPAIWLLRDSCWDGGVSPSKCGRGCPSFCCLWNCASRRLRGWGQCDLLEHHRDVMLCAHEWGRVGACGLLSLFLVSLGWLISCHTVNTSWMEWCGPAFGHRVVKLIKNEDL